MAPPQQIAQSELLRSSPVKQTVYILPLPHAAASSLSRLWGDLRVGVTYAARHQCPAVCRTITKSDLLGHLLPMMSYDWAHSGITHLFHNIQVRPPSLAAIASNVRACRISATHMLAQQEAIANSRCTGLAAEAAGRKATV